MPGSNQLFAMAGYTPPDPPDPPPDLTGEQVTTVRTRVATVLGDDAMPCCILVHTVTVAARELDEITTITADQVREVILGMIDDELFEPGYGC